MKKGIRVKRLCLAAFFLVMLCCASCSPNLDKEWSDFYKNSTKGNAIVCETDSNVKLVYYIEDRYGFLNKDGEMHLITLHYISRRNGGGIFQIIEITKEIHEEIKKGEYSSLPYANLIFQAPVADTHITNGTNAVIEFDELKRIKNECFGDFSELEFRKTTISSDEILQVDEILK